MGFGLILTGILNILFGLSSSFLFFAIFLGLNGFFQGWGSPPCAKLLTYWYSQKERGRWWGVWNTSHNLGGALIPIMGTLAIQLFGWRHAMFFPGTLAVIGGVFLINRLRDTPKSIGLPTIEKHNADYLIDEKESDETKKLSIKETLIKYIFKNKLIWILAASYFFVYIIRTALNDWIHIYLIQEKGYTKMLAATCITFFEMGGFIGSIAAGHLSDTIFKGNRGPVNILFIFGIILILFLISFISSNSFLFISPIMFFSGFLIFGPQMLIGMAAAELVDKKAAGTATGFTGLFAYLGAACAGFPVGLIQKEFGWNGVFFLLSICAIIAVSLLFPFWSKKKLVATSTFKTNETR